MGHACNPLKEDCSESAVADESQTTESPMPGPMAHAYRKRARHRRRGPHVSLVHFEEGSEVVGDVRAEATTLDYQADTFSRTHVTVALGQISKELYAAFTQFDLYATETVHKSRSVAPEVLSDFAEMAIETLAEELLKCFAPIVATLCKNFIARGLELREGGEGIELTAKRLVAEAAKLDAAQGQLAEQLLDVKRFEFRNVYRSSDGDREHREHALTVALANAGLGFPTATLRQAVYRKLIEKLEFAIWVGRCRGYGPSASMVLCASGDDQVRGEIAAKAGAESERAFSEKKE